MLSLAISIQAWSAERAYYSTGAGVSVKEGSSRITLGTTVQAAGLTLTATIRPASVLNILGVQVAGPTATVRLPLSSEAPGGYRAGILVSTNNTSLLSAQALDAVTLRTYRQGVLQETNVVDASLVQLALLAAAGQPRQLEFTTSSTKPFDAVEVEFNPGLLNVNLLGNITTNIRYAYGVAPAQPKAVMGYLSQFSTASNDLFSTANSTNLPIAVCVNSQVTNPANAVDNDLTNYAYFNTTAGVGCTSTLRVKLAGMVPASGYRAGFVVGNSGLIDVSVLSGLRLRTYLGNTEQESSADGALLDVKLLADDKLFLNFQATKAFDAVSIERVSTVELLNNLRLYYGFGLSESVFTNVPIATSYPLSTGRFANSQGGLACVGCPTYVVTPTNGTPPYIRLSQAITAGGTNEVRFELNGVQGMRGNRAGIVLGNTSLLDANVLQNTTLLTYDAAGNVLETFTSGAALALNVLPDNRREVSFRTTRDFAQVGISINSTLGLLTDVNVYSAFADDLGLLQLTAPPAPLPVVLTSFGVSRAAGAVAADVTWTTASEQNSASFVVERTADPQAGFVAIGQVAAAGTSTATHQYTLRDATAPMGVILYYRLRQLDFDGSEHLSPVAVLDALAASNGVAFSLYPNPAPAGTVSLSLPGTATAGTTVAIYSSIGRLLSQQALSASDGPSAALSTTELPTGVYQVVLRSGAGQKLGAQRLVIIR